MSAYFKSAVIADLMISVYKRQHSSRIFNILNSVLKTRLDELLRKMFKTANNTVTPIKEIPKFLDDPDDRAIKNKITTFIKNYDGKLSNESSHNI